MQRRRVRDRCACGRTDAGRRRGRPARGSPRSCRRTACRAGSRARGRGRSPRPGSSVFTSSPGITIRSRSRARSAVSSAPPKTLWSVTAIAPRPSASAWSTSSAGSIAAVERPRGVHVQVGDDPRPVGERVGRRGARAAAPLRQRRVERARARAATSSNELPAAASRERAPARRRAASSSSASRATAAAGELGLVLDAARRARSRSRRPAPRAARARARRCPGTKIAASFRSAAREAPSRAVRRRTRPARSRGIAGRPTSGFVRSSTASQPGSSRSARSDAAGDGALVRAQLDDDQLPLRRRARRASASTPGETQRGSRRGTAPRPRRAIGSREREQRVEPAEQLLALRAGRRVARAGRARRTSRP